MNWDTSARLKVIALALSAAAALNIAALAANGQTQTESNSPERKPDLGTIQTFNLVNCADMNELNDIQTSLRNVLPRAHIYADSSRFAITLRGTPEDLDAAQKLIASLDKPLSVYRLTYTITDIDGGRHTGEQHFVLLAVAGQRSIFKQGSRVPIVIGSIDKGDPMRQSTQVQYLDVGLNIDATITGAPDALCLHSKIEQTSPIEENSAMSARDPKIHQTVLDENFQLAQGKPLVLGSFDLPGTTRHQEIAVVAEPVQ